MYHDNAVNGTGVSNEEKKGLLQGEPSHPLEPRQDHPLGE